MAVVFSAIYLVALVLFLVGVFGWFGQEIDPMAGVFLLPLGLPWVRFVDLFPEPTWPWLVAAVPILNLVILRLMCRLFPR